MFSCVTKRYYCLFKTFFRFWLAQIARLILHNQIALTKLVQYRIIARKMGGNRGALGMRLRCFGREVQNGGTFHTFCEKEISQLLLKNCRTATSRIQLEGWHCHLEDICRTKHPFISWTFRETGTNGDNHLLAFFSINYLEYKHTYTLY